VCVLRARPRAARLALVALAAPTVHEALHRLMTSYPKREVPRDGALDRAFSQLCYFAGKASLAARRLPRIVAATTAAERGLEGLGREALAERARRLRPRLHRE